MARRPTARAAARRSRPLKVVVTGPFGAGKTTLIQALSEIPVLSTEREVSGSAERAVKGNTTVAMDFGRLTVDAELVLYLFGTPGQRRFDFMWEILAEGMLGFLVLVDCTRDESFDEAAEMLDFFRAGANVPFVVAVNKGEEGDRGVNLTRERLGLAEGVRCFAVDARDRESVKSALLELLYAVLDDISGSGPGTAAEAAAV